MDIKSIVATAIKKYFTEVAQPKSPNEQRFVDQHTIEFWPHPVAFDSQFDGTIQKDTSRDADYQPGEDAAVYDQAYATEETKARRNPRKRSPEKIAQIKKDDIETAKAIMRDRIKRGATDKLTKESLDETYKAGAVQFKDGSKVTIKAEEASLLNKLYSSLDTIRQKDMKEHVGKSAKNYKAVLEFAIATKGK